MNPNECQFNSLPTIAEGKARLPWSFSKFLKHLVRSHLSERQDEIICKYYHEIMNRFSKGISKKIPYEIRGTDVKRPPLKAGDLVRVRSKEEIMATLDPEGKTKGCGFMDVQECYCGTVHRVLKQMERFVDERDYQVKKCKGLVLLEGVTCKGVKAYGRCDRSCLIFWREEWLEKL